MISVPTLPTMLSVTASSLPEAIGVNGYSYLYASGLPIEQIAPDGGYCTQVGMPSSLYLRVPAEHVHYYVC